jgi:hypothetical protein
MRTLQSGASWICKGQSNSCQVVEDVVLQKGLALNLKDGPSHDAMVIEIENKVYFVLQQQQQRAFTEGPIYPQTCLNFF